MAKPKNPLLSLEAHGTIAKTLTYQTRYEATMVRKRPVPRQPRTLPQIYHRWDYQDYVAWWDTLTITQRQVWNSYGSQHHMTGFAAFMGDRLADLTDLEARYRLDETTGTIAYDSSKHGRNGTIVGTTSIPGVISYARRFDGIDDRIETPIQLTEEGTIHFWVVVNNPIGTRTESIFGCLLPPNNYFTTHLVNDGFSYWGWGIAGVGFRIKTNTPLPTGWFFVDLTWSTTTGITRLRWNAAVIGQTAGLPAIFTMTFPPDIGAYNQGGVHVDHLDGDIDNFVVCNRVLPDADLDRQHERSYPV